MDSNLINIIFSEIRSSVCFHLFMLSAQILKNLNISELLNKKRLIFISDSCMAKNKDAKKKRVSE